MAFEWTVLKYPLVVIVFLCSVVGVTNSKNVEIQIMATIEMKEKVNDTGGFTTIYHDANRFQGFKVINRIDDKIYVGGREALYIISGEEVINISIATCEDPNKILKCAQIISTDKVSKFCSNYIRVAEELGGNYTLVCGTNSDGPVCYKLNLQNGTSYTCENSVGIDASQVVQFLVTQNSTAIYHNGTLYVGLNDQRQQSPARVASYSVSENDLNLIARSIENDNSVNEPDFVGKPYIKDGFVYFFYRETAVEAINQGKFVYSRVARVCLDDVGYRNDYISYFKARLNCSLQGQYPFYFNYIQDVTVQEEDSEVYFHAVFTTTPHGPPSSAVCTYRLSDIVDVFENSRNKGEVSPQLLPAPVAHPAFREKYKNCKLNFSYVEQDELDFLKRYPLKDDLVPNYNKYSDTPNLSDRPLFYSNSMNFYSIAVDATSEIYYIGTESGAILKAFYMDDVADVQSYSMDTAKIKSAVVGLEFLNTSKSLIATTDSGIYNLSVTYCKATCEEECDAFYHKYCSSIDKVCQLHSNVSVGTSLNVSQNVKILSVRSGSNITSCNGRTVELTCEVKSSSLCGGALLTWKFKEMPLVTCNGSDDCQGLNSTVAHLVQYTRIASSEHYKLVHLTVQVYKGHTDGMYSCESEDSSTSVRIVTDTSDGCLTEDLYNLRSETHTMLENEWKELDKCGKNSTLNMSLVMFQECDQCQGGPHINPNVT